jgi:hypothetical protein
MWEATMIHANPHHHRHCPCLGVLHLIEKVFWAAAATCLLYAVHRIATALKLNARVKVLDEMGDTLTDEERAVLTEKIKARALNL